MSGEMENRMGADIFERFPDRETFDQYWKDHYVPVAYEDVRVMFENFVKLADGHIYLSDYEEKGCVSRADFKDNLSQEAQFMFEDGLTEIFYEKNPQLYETAFAIYEEAQLSGQGDENVAQIFHETFRRLYAEFLDRLYDEVLA
ncbi:MAG: serine/threonine protein phosphatase [Roseburia sp.]